jgi:hypothetical protein
MTSKNGEIQAPKPRPEEDVEQMGRIAPLDVHLNSCGFQVVKQPNGAAILIFQHQSGLMRFTAALPPDAVADLIQMLTGGVTIARSMPVMQ